MTRALVLAGLFAFAANPQPSTDPVEAQQHHKPQPSQLQKEKDGAQAAAAAGAGAAIVATQLVQPPDDVGAFPAPTQRARQLLGYASPWTLLILAAVIVLLAALIKKFDPKGRQRM